MTIKNILKYIYIYTDIDWIVYYATSVKAAFPLKHKNTTILFEILVVLAMTRGAIKHISAKVGRQDLRKRGVDRGKKDEEI